MKVLRHGKSATHLTLENDSDIVIMEKLDGANASFKKENGELKCFSRRQELSENNTLRGFYNWVHENIDPDDLAEGYIYFGEWLVKHKLDYGQNNMNKFYLFDVYNEKHGRYVSFDNVEMVANKLNIDLIPVFYHGRFQSLEHIQSFVGKSKLGDVGEGVVVKNYNWTDKHGNQQFTKFVSDQFAEKKQAKKHRIPPKKGTIDEFVGINLTNARIDKMLHKMVDEGILEEDYDITDMGTILKNAGTRIYEDIIEEELDELLKQIKKKIGKKLPEAIKSVLAEQGRV